MRRPHRRSTVAHVPAAVHHMGVVQALALLEGKVAERGAEVARRLAAAIHRAIGLQGITRQSQQAMPASRHTDAGRHPHRVALAEQAAAVEHVVGMRAVAQTARRIRASSPHTAVGIAAVGSLHA